MRINVVAVSIGTLLLLAGCGGGSGGESLRYDSADAVVAAIDKHTLSFVEIPKQQLLGG